MYKYKKEFIKIVFEVKEFYEIEEKSFVQMQSIANKFIEYLSEANGMDNRPIEEISTFDMNNYFMYMMNDKGSKWDTIQSHYHQLKKVFTYMYEYDNGRDVFKGFDVNKYKTKENSKKKTFEVNEKEILKLYNFIVDESNDLKERLLLATILKNGLTISEILLLRRCDVDLDEKYLYTKKTLKGNVRKKRVLADEVYSLFKQYIAENKIQYRDVPIFEIKIDKFRGALKSICKKCIGRELTPTQLRQTMMYSILKEDRDKTILIAKIFDLDVSGIKKYMEEYEIASEEDIDEDARKLLNRFNENKRKAN